MRPIELRARRLALGLSQAELARICVLAQVSVSAWENGTRRVPAHIDSELSRIEGLVNDLTDQMAYAAEQVHDQGNQPTLIVHTSDQAFWEQHPEMDGLPCVLQQVAAARALAVLAEAGITIELIEPGPTEQPNQRQQRKGKHL